MAISKLTGPMLSNVLVRDGQGLAFSDSANSTPTLFIDIANARIGVNTSTPNTAFTINGAGYASSLNLTNNISLGGDVIANGNAIITNITASGNVTTVNLEATGFANAVNISASGNINAFANIVSGNINSVNISASGNINSVNVSASGNINSVNMSSSGNIIASNVSANGLTSTSNLNVSGSANINSLSVTNISVSGNITGNVTTSTTGNIDAGNLSITGTTYLGNINVTNTTISPIGNVVIFAGTTGIAVPIGNTIQRPSSPVSGTVRFNTENNDLETWSGTDWVNTAAQFTQILDQQITGTDATTYALAYPTDDNNSIIVSINGITQRPGAAYNVVGTDIEFANPLLTSEVADIRYLTYPVPVGEYGNANVAAYLATNTANLAGGNILSDNYLYANGTPIPFGVTYGNANVEAYLPTSNTIISINGNVSNTNSNVANIVLDIANTNSNVANTDSNVANIVLDIANTNSNVANTDSNVANIVLDIANTNSNVANTDSNVANIVLDIANTNSNVTTLSNTVANNSSNITTLQGQVYANANVAAYLPTYLGDITAGIVTATGNVYGSDIVAGNSVQVGNLTFYDNYISSIVANGDIQIGTTGSGQVQIEANAFTVSTTTNPNPIFDIQPSGEVLMYVPTFDADAGGLNIIGSSDGNFIAPTNAGAMLHITGQDGAVSRVYNDAAGTYALYTGRRFNGNVNAPTVLNQGDSIVRYAATPYVGSNTNAGFAALGSARFDFIATETMSNTTQGTRILVSVTANGTNTQSNVVSFTSNGIVFESDGSIQSTAGIPLTQRGNALGVATLDVSGKVPTAQLPTGAVVYVGNWDASTNTPTLTNGSGTSGYEYSVTVGGTVDFGAGPITFFAGDFVIYTASGEWQQIPGSVTVASFNGRTGAVTLSSTDVSDALGYTAYNGNTNPNGYVNTAGAQAAAPVQNFNGRVGNIVLASSDVTTALTSGALINAKLANSNIVIGNTIANLGATVTTIAGLSSISSASLVGNVTGLITDPVVNLGAQTGNTITLDFSSQSIVRATYDATTFTVSFANYTAGRKVTLILQNVSGAGRTFNVGVTAQQTTNNDATPTVASNRLMIIDYYSTGTNNGNVFASINYN